MMKIEKRWTDEDCEGCCRCPTCGGPAHWSFHEKRHACADPACRTEFTEHDLRESARPPQAPETTP